jgi:glycosyltransferase involved in cell wall biosynthesis
VRLLHVGSGFRPWRQGGLVAYTEDLMAAQVARGDDVTYFFAGRIYPWGRGPRLRRWERDAIAMLEMVDSPLHDHGRQPAQELDERRVERLFEGVLDQTRPDVVHVHELAGLPSSLLGIARRAGVATVLTLQDYFLLCPAFKLIDADGRVCLRREVGADCVATLAADPRPPWMTIEASVRYDLMRTPLVRRLPQPRLDRLAGKIARRAPALRKAPPRADDLQRRRDVNVARLSEDADAVVAMSHRVAEIHAELGVDPAVLRVVQLTLRHIERLRPRRASGAAPVTFVTLASLESEAKGARVLLDALRRLGAGPYRVLVYGHISPEFRDEAAALPGVELRGAYRAAELDALLDEADVGLLTSVWEEAYGYAGVELLAKGIPVIANAIGGMVDYARDGETGWLNRSCTGEELARIMGALAAHPERVAELNARVLDARERIVKPLSRHAEEMDELYEELVDVSSRA